LNCSKTDSNQKQITRKVGEIKALEEITFKENSFKLAAESGDRRCMFDKREQSSKLKLRPPEMQDHQVINGVLKYEQQQSMSMNC